jgi:phage terminase large subunit
MSSTWLGVDYGTVNPFSALLFGLGEDSKVYVMAELYWDSRKENHQKTDAQYSADVMEFLRFHNVSPEWTYVDPSAASFVQQLWRDGLPGVRPADNKVVDGIRTVSTALAQDRIRVHESCKSLINEIGGYVWDAKAQKRGLDQPLKSEDHSVDAMRYGLASTKFFWSRLHIVNDMEVAS